MTAEVNVPDGAVNAGWHEFRYPRPATDEPSEAFLRGLRAAATLIVAAELERMAELIWQEHGVGNQGDEDYVTGVDDSILMIRGRAAELRGESR